MTAPVDWLRRNLRLLSLFAPVLIVAGVAGMLVPPELALMSGALPYDVFHIVFGALGLAIVVARAGRLAALFNLGFGAIDLYQALAGPLGLFPAALFGLRPADHVVHVVLGLLLVGFGVRGVVPRAPDALVREASLPAAAAAPGAVEDKDRS
ncbi:MAG TPA: hypothetical protein VHL80_11295 [Polyangia bacterium]|nr:hypothetical protein [Polyangia bacterium]